ncbi:hypothetical protein BJX64DRAFT_252700 [Aspergillus heterothallicus]
MLNPSFAYYCILRTSTNYTRMIRARLAYPFGQIPCIACLTYLPTLDLNPLSFPHYACTHQSFLGPNRVVHTHPASSPTN